MHRKKFIINAAILAGSGFRLPFMNLKDAAPLRVGIIGTGNRGNGIARLLKKQPEFNILACCDTNAGHLNNTLKLLPGAKGYADYRALLAQKDIDAVVIATPLYLHAPMALQALAAGKHVYLEKTMTYSTDEAIALEKATLRSGLTLQVGHQYRYYPLYHRAKEVIQQNWLGSIRQIECQYHRNSNWRNPVSQGEKEREVNWRMYREYSGGLMAELCAHQIDIVNWMLDKHPTSVMGAGSINYWKDGRETYDNVRCVFDYADGARLSSTSILSNAFRGYSIRLLGTKGTLEILRDQAHLYAEDTTVTQELVDGVTGASKRITGENGEPLKFEDKHLDPTSLSLMAFREAILKKEMPLSNVTSGKESAICVHLANKAMETERRQRWPSL